MFSRSTTTAQGERHPLSGENNQSLLDVRDLSVQYLTDRGPAVAVDQVSFSIAPGEVLGLAGESGSGKSTIALAIMRLLRAPALITGGHVLLNQRDILEMSQSQLQRVRWRDVSMVFQSAMNSLNPVASVGEQMLDVLRMQGGMSASQAKERAAELLKFVGIDQSRLGAFPHQLSGGMRQRVVIAIALALNPSLIIMDEPTTALDVVVQKEIMQQIAELRSRLGFSVLFITHDLSLLVEFSDRIAIMYAGQIVEHGPSRELFRNPLHPYTRGLLNSFPTTTGELRRLEGITGSPPDLVTPPSGCRFHPRCSEVEPAFKRTVPRLQEVTPNHYVACHLYEDPRVREMAKERALAQTGHQT